MIRPNHRLAFFILILFALLTACTANQPQTPTAVPATPSPSIQPATPVPSLTPTPQPQAILIAPADSDPALKGALGSLLAGLARQEGLAFRSVPSLSPAELTSETRVVAALPPDSGLATLAASAPTVQFLAVGIPGLQAAENLSLVDISGRPDQQGFLAGYLASVLTQDWRVGVISRGDTAQGNAARQGFINGAIFFCGLCRPAYPPFVQYPLSADLAAGAGQAEQQAAADALIAQGVQTVYVYPDAGDQFLLEYLAGAGVDLIGGVTPPASVKEHWIATIQSDWSAAVKAAWSQIIRGEPFEGQSTGLTLTDRNEALFSEGRQRLVDQTMDELEIGLIDTGVDPLTGESR